MKQCRICEVLKPLDDFSINQGRCKSCAADFMRRRRWEERKLDLNSIRPWAFHDDAKLLALVVLGARLEEIATLLDRTYKGVDARLQKMRQSVYAPFIPSAKPRWTSAQIADLHDLIGVKGYTRKRAARQLGVTEGAAIRAAQRHLPQLCRKRQARVGV